MGDARRMGLNGGGIRKVEMVAEVNAKLEDKMNDKIEICVRAAHQPALDELMIELGDLELFPF